MDQQPSGPRLLSASLDTVRRLEGFTIAALPARESWELPAWLCLANGSRHVGRVNSAMPLPARTGAEGAEPATILQVAQSYRARGLKPLVRWTPLAPSGIAEQLTAAGWSSGREVLIMTRSLSTAEVRVPDQNADRNADRSALAEHERRAEPQAEPQAESEAGLHADASQSWSTAYTSAYDHDEGLVRLRLALSAPAPRRFATVKHNGQTAGVGLGVCLDGVVGVFDVLTLPEYRRRGVARRVVGSLLEWGRREGADLAFLQVAASNSAAVALYREFGFDTAYTYVYAAPSLDPG